MNKKVIIIGSIVFLTAGICLAIVFDFYLKMHGTMETAGPEFYIGSAEEETLLVNEKPKDCAHFGINGGYRVFKTDDLEVSDFGYIPKAHFSVRAKVATDTPQNLILNFGYFDTLDSLHPVCSYSVSLTNTLNDYTSDPVVCSEMPANVKNFYYEFQKGCTDCDYTISKCASGFYSKVELQK